MTCMPNSPATLKRELEWSSKLSHLAANRKVKMTWTLEDLVKVRARKVERVPKVKANMEAKARRKIKEKVSRVENMENMAAILAQACPWFVSTAERLDITRRIADHPPTIATTTKAKVKEENPKEKGNKSAVWNNRVNIRNLKERPKPAISSLPCWLQSRTMNQYREKLKYRMLDCQMQLE